MRKFLTIIEAACVFAALGLGAAWFVSPTGNFEPLIVILLSVPVGIEIYSRAKKQREIPKIQDIPAKQKLGRSNKQLLFVDDDKYFLEDAQKLLISKGITSLTALSAKEAIDIYKRESDSIDIIVTDLMMRPTKDPELEPYLSKGLETGVALAQWIQNDDPTKSIIGCSAVSHREESGEWFINSANGLITKPLDRNMEELTKFINKKRKEEC